MDDGWMEPTQKKLTVASRGWHVNVHRTIHSTFLKKLENFSTKMLWKKSSENLLS